MNRRGEWSLSPAFDVTYAWNPAGEWTSRHQMSINGKREGFERKDLLALASTAGIKRAHASQMLDSVIEAVRRWPDYAGKAKVPDRRVNEIQRNQRTELWRSLSVGEIHSTSLALREKGRELQRAFSPVSLFLTTRPFSQTTKGVLVWIAIFLASLAARRKATPAFARSSSRITIFFLRFTSSLLHRLTPAFPQSCHEAPTYQPGSKKMMILCSWIRLLVWRLFTISPQGDKHLMYTRRTWK